MLRRKLFCCKSKASFPNRSCRPGCVVDALSVVGDLEFQDILGQTSITDESELTCSSIGVSVYLGFGKRVAPNDASFRWDCKVSQDPAQDVNSQEAWNSGGSRQHSMLHVAACSLRQSPQLHHVSTSLAFPFNLPSTSRRHLSKKSSPGPTLSNTFPNTSPNAVLESLSYNRKVQRLEFVGGPA